MTIAADELCGLTAGALRDLLVTGAVSAREVAAAHLDRIERLDPAVNAMVTVTADLAMQTAGRLDEDLVHGGPVGPLHGLPFGFKDLTPVAGVRTTFGSLTHRDHVPRRHALVAERVLAAGAVPLGKTNTPEFGVGPSTRNSVAGITRNPLNPELTAGGSSGGSAAALAAGMVALADGTDMAGSLRAPAVYCGVVGLRPTPGRVPGLPFRNGWFDLATPGPMARDVPSLALNLSAMAGPDPRIPGVLPEAGSSFFPVGGLPRRPRVALAAPFGGLAFETEIVEAVLAQREVLVELGCQVQDAAPDFTDAGRIFRILRGWHMRSMLGSRIAAEWEAWDPLVRSSMVAAQQVTLDEVSWAVERRSTLFRRAGEFWRTVDFLVLPATQTQPFPAADWYPSSLADAPVSDYLDAMGSSFFVSLLGAPSLALPVAGDRRGMPIGVQIVGRPGDDRGVLALAGAWEKARGPLPVPPTAVAS